MRRARAVAATTLAMLLAACDGPEPPPHLRVAGGDVERGRALIAEHGCGACHRIPGMRGARGTVGPPLTDFATRTLIAGSLPNSASNLIAWIVDPPAIRPRTAMPAVGAAPDEARHIAAFLYTLGAEQVDRRPGGPPLGTVPEGAAADLERRAMDELGRYRWVDAQAGIAAIPIQRAIELIAAQGVETRESEP